MTSYLQEHAHTSLYFFFICYIVLTCTKHPIRILFPDWNCHSCFLGICGSWHFHNLRVWSLVDAQLYNAQPEISLQFVEAEYSKYIRVYVFHGLINFFYCLACTAACVILATCNHLSANAIRGVWSADTGALPHCLSIVRGGTKKNNLGLPIPFAQVLRPSEDLDN